MKAEETIQHESDADNTMVTDLRRQVERQWIDQNVSLSQNRVITEVVTVTPSLAMQLLERNPDNRPMQTATVENYARDMENGRFDGLNGEALKVSSDGYLNDGQHRCRAIIKTGVPLKTLMVFGVARESRKTLDGGAKRTVGHYLSMEGFNNANNIAGAAKLIWMIEKTGKIRTGDAVPTAQTVREFAVENYDVIYHSLRAVNHKGASHICRGLSILTAAHYFMAKKNREEADAFFESLIEGTGLQKHDAIWSARSKLLNRSSQKDKRYNHNEIFKILFYCWNKYREGKPVRQIQESVNNRELLPTLK